MGRNDGEITDLHLQPERGAGEQPCEPPINPTGPTLLVPVLGQVNLHRPTPNWAGKRCFCQPCSEGREYWGELGSKARMGMGCFLGTTRWPSIRERKLLQLGVERLQRHSLLPRNKRVSAPLAVTHLLAAP